MLEMEWRTTEATHGFNSSRTRSQGDALSGLPGLPALGRVVRPVTHILLEYEGTSGLQVY